MLSPIKKITQTRLLIFLVIVGFFIITLAHAKDVDNVRVCIKKNVKSFSIKIAGSYKVLDAKTRKILFRGRDSKTMLLSLKQGMRLGKIYLNSDNILIKTTRSEAISIANRMYRGNLQVIKGNRDLLSVINHIELEDYLKGVLYHEVSHHWPEDALKAQAIASRTFAINQMAERKNQDYDVTSDIYSQVYGGSVSERFRTNRAVELTKGQILTFRGKIFPTYYHATCAGHTEDSSVLWNIKITPLMGVRCKFCLDSPHTNWSSVLTKKQIIAKLKKKGHKLKSITNILLVGKTASSRVKDLKIVTKAKELVISAKDFRNTIGPNIIKSTKFVVSIVGQDVIFEGYGWGHGVGMCQWGAYFMAREGNDYQSILQHFYPDSEISDVAKIK